MKKLIILFLVALVSSQVEANYNFAIHTDSHPWAREDPKGAQEEIDTVIKLIEDKVNLEAFEPKNIKGLADWGRSTYGGWWKYLDSDRYHAIIDLSDRQRKA